MVTQTMIPKSLAKLSDASAAWAAQSTAAEDDDSWLPPLLGSWGGELDEDDSAGYDDEDEVEDAAQSGAPSTGMGSEGAARQPLTPAASKDLHALVSQLKSLTARLGALEAQGGGASAGGVTQGWGDALMKALKREGLAVGGATAMAVAAVVLYRKGRRAGR